MLTKRQKKVALQGAIFVMFQGAIVVFLNAQKPTTESLLKQKLVVLHIPKTGTSFEFLLTKVKCPGLNAEIAQAVAQGLENSFYPTLYITFHEKHSPRTRQCKSQFASFVVAHPPLTPGKAPVVLMVREPLHRIVSGYLDYFHDCDRLRRHIVHDPNTIQDKLSYPAFITHVKDNFYLQNSSTSIFKYAQCVSGCTTNMLIGRTCAQGKPSIKQIAAAKDVFHQRVVFAGITERWQDTVRLWYKLNAIIDPPTNDVLHNIRPSMAPTQLQHDILHVLRDSGFVDPADQAIHTLATQRMDSMLLTPSPTTKE